MIRNLCLYTALALGLAVPAHAQVSMETVGEDLAVVYFFGRLDTNKDGVVSHQEYNALFAAADADASNSVNIAEMMQQKEREKAVMMRVMTGKK